MSKAFLVIDMPEKCIECPCFEFGMDNYCAVTGEINYSYNNSKPSDCPLKPVPEKKHQPQYCGNGVFGYRTAMEYEYARGWNECIDYFIGK